MTKECKCEGCQCEMEEAYMFETEYNCYVGFNFVFDDEGTEHRYFYAIDKKTGEWVAG